MHIARLLPTLAKLFFALMSCVGVLFLLLCIEQTPNKITLSIDEPGAHFYQQFSYIERNTEHSYRWSLAESAIVVPMLRDGWHIAAVTLANQLPIGTGISTETTLDLGAYPVVMRLAPSQHRNLHLLIRPEPLGWPEWRIGLHTDGVRYGDGSRELGVSVLGASFIPTNARQLPRLSGGIAVVLPFFALWGFFRMLGHSRCSEWVASASTLLLLTVLGCTFPVVWPLLAYWAGVWLLAAVFLSVGFRQFGIWSDSPLRRGVIVVAAGGAIGPLALRMLTLYDIPLHLVLLVLYEPWAVGLGLAVIAGVVCVPSRSPLQPPTFPQCGPRWQRMGVAGLSVIIMIRTIQTAWISDDAQITLRTVMNALHGNGLTFNLAERVQAYAHTLWFFVLWGGSMLTGNIYIATFCASILCAAISVLQLVRLGGRPRGGLLVGLATLTLSKAYIDYSTSGLENPLTHVLLLCAIVLGDQIVFRRKTELVVWLVTIIGLIFLNRPDALLLIAPFGAYVFWGLRKERRVLARALAIGVLPVAVWTCFSLWYYGFPLPNTAYAKVGTGIAPAELLVQAGQYFGQTLSHDPLTLVAIGLVLLLSIRARWYERSVAIGIVGYLAAMTLVGGDFMQGRFFAAPLLLAVVLLSRIPLPQTIRRLLAVIVMCLGVVGQTQPIAAGYADIQAGIADERAFYAPRFGLYTADAATFQQPDWTIGKPRFVTLCGGVGRTGLFFGPSLHILDSCALTDPLLSKLPAKYDPAWRIGHFYRVIPTKYFDSIMRAQNTLTDPALARYYDAIRLATRGNLWSTERLMAIVALNLGSIHVPPAGIYRTMCVPLTRGDWHVPARWLANPVYGGRRGTAGNIVFGDAVVIDLPKPTALTSIDLSLNTDDVYEIEAHTMTGTRVLVRIDHGMAAVHYGPQHAVAVVKRESSGVMARFTLTVIQPMSAAHGLRIHGSEGDGRYAIGHLVVHP